MDQNAPDQPQISDIVRDDNLRLLFSEAAKRELSERLKAIDVGFVVLALTVLLAVTAWALRLAWNAPETDRPLFEILVRFDTPQDFMVSTVLLCGAIVTVLSPVIFGMLMMERRKFRRELRDLLSLLKRYDRA